MIKAFDAVMLGLILSVWVTLGFWKIFGDPSPMNLIAGALVNISVTQFWLISLAYRCAFFVLQTRADVNLLPMEAARLALGYMTGGRRSQ